MYTFTKYPCSVLQLTKEINVVFGSSKVSFVNQDVANNLSIWTTSLLSVEQEAQLLSIVNAHIPTVSNSEIEYTISNMDGTYHNLFVTAFEYANVIRINCTKASVITGINLRRPITIINIGNKSITLKTNSNLSLPENRMLINTDRIIGPDEIRDLFYDETISRVRVK